MRSLFLGGANAFAKMELHWKQICHPCFHVFPTISWNQWWGVFSFFLGGVFFYLFFKVVWKRWAPLNEDFFAVLFLGLETRFTINWKFVPVSRCERLKQDNFVVVLISMLQVHVAILFQNLRRSAPPPWNICLIYRLNNLIILGVCERGGPPSHPI